MITATHTAKRRPTHLARTPLERLRPYFRLGRLTLRHLAREHGLLAVVVALHIAFAYVAKWSGTTEILTYPIWSLRYTVGIIKLSLWIPVVALVWECWRARKRGAVYGIKEWRRRYLNLRTLSGVVIGATLVAHAMLAHDAWKRMIGVATAYSWDKRLADLDRGLHFGVDPWQILRVPFQSPEMTAALDTVYWLWFPFAATGISWILWTRLRQLRMQFLLAWALTWLILGTVLAHAFASGGPFAYHHLVTGHNPFNELMLQLHRVNQIEPLVALQLQAQVWANVATGSKAQWWAMSAMPSLHVAVPVLYAIGVGSVSRRLGAGFWAFATLILIGSVHLGWHYAVDGYVSIAAVIVIWRIAGWATKSAPTITLQSKPLESPVRTL